MGPPDYLSRLRALGRTLRERHSRLHHLACAWCRNRSLADDLVQETFLKALRNLGQLRDVSAMDAWLGNILHNCWRDHLRRQKVIEDIDAFAEDEAMAVELRQERAEIVTRVRTAITRLPAGQREVLMLVDLVGYSYAEVAALLDIPTGTVTSRISRAREALRAELADLAGGQDRGHMPLRRVK